MTYRYPPMIPAADTFAASFRDYPTDHVFPIGDGWEIAVSFEPDDFTIFDECEDTYGRFEWVDRRRENAYGYPQRPSGMDGAARILRPNGYRCDSPVWWRPPADVVKMGPDALNRWADTVTTILADGYYVAEVELVDPDGTPRGRTEYLGALDSVGPWLAEYVADMADEIRSGIVASLARKVGTVPAILEGSAR